MSEDIRLQQPHGCKRSVLTFVTRMPALWIIRTIRRSPEIKSEKERFHGSGAALHVRILKGPTKAGCRGQDPEPI